MSEKQSITLKTGQIVRLFKALKALDGRQKAYVVGGQQKIITEPYDMSDQAAWNITIMMNRLKPFVEAHDRAQMECMKKLRAVNEKLDPAPEKKAENKAAAEAAVAEMNQVMEGIDETERQIDDVRRIPAVGLGSVSQYSKTVLLELLPIIDGEPEFPPEPQQEAKEPVKRK